MFIEKGLFYSICGFALSICLSTAVSNIFLGLGLFFAGLSLFKQGNKLIDIEYTLFLKLMGIFLLVLFLSGILSDNIRVSMKEFLNVYVLRMAIFILMISVKFSKERSKYVFWCLCISLVMTSIYAIYQGINGSPRAMGFSKHYMYLAGQYCYFLPVLLVNLLDKQITNSIKEKIFLAIVFSFCLLGLLFNATRGVWLSTACVFALIFVIYSYRSWQNLIIGALLGIIIVLGIQSNPYFIQRIYSVTNFTTDQSNLERIRIWESASNMVKDHPVLGIGVGRFTDRYQKDYILPTAKGKSLRHAHNFYIEILAENGIIGLISALAMYFYSAYFGISRFFIEKNAWYLCIFCVTFSFLLQGITEWASSVFKYFWFVLGLCYLLAKKNNNKQS